MLVETEDIRGWYVKYKSFLKHILKHNFTKLFLASKQAREYQGCSNNLTTFCTHERAKFNSARRLRTTMLMHKRRAGTGRERTSDKKRNTASRSLSSFSHSSPRRVEHSHIPHSRLSHSSTAPSIFPLANCIFEGKGASLISDAGAGKHMWSVGAEELMPGGLNGGAV